MLRREHPFLSFPSKAHFLFLQKLRNWREHLFLSFPFYSFPLFIFILFLEGKTGYFQKVLIVSVIKPQGSFCILLSESMCAKLVLKKTPRNLVYPFIN